MSDKAQTASEIFEERTRGLRAGERLRSTKVGTKVTREEVFAYLQAYGFFESLRDALLEYIRAGEEWARDYDKAMDKYDPEGSAVGVGPKLRTALDTLRERMEP